MSLDLKFTYQSYAYCHFILISSLSSLFFLLSSSFLTFVSSFLSFWYVMFDKKAKTRQNILLSKQAKAKKLWLSTFLISQYTESRWCSCINKIDDEFDLSQKLKLLIYYKHVCFLGKKLRLTQMQIENFKNFIIIFIFYLLIITFCVWISTLIKDKCSFISIISSIIKS